MAKVGILNPFFSRYFLGVLTRFMALFMAGDTHSLLFSNILLTHHQSITDAFEEKNYFVRNAKKCKHCSCSCAFPQSMILFQLCIFLCQIFSDKLCACLSVGAFCKADIYAKSKGEHLSTFSEKM